MREAGPSPRQPVAVIGLEECASRGPRCRICGPPGRPSSVKGEAGARYGAARKRARATRKAGGGVLRTKREALSSRRTCRRNGRGPRRETSRVLDQRRAGPVRGGGAAIEGHRLFYGWATVNAGLPCGGPLRGTPQLFSARRRPRGSRRGERSGAGARTRTRGRTADARESSSGGSGKASRAGLAQCRKQAVGAAASSRHGGRLERRYFPRRARGQPATLRGRGSRLDGPRQKRVPLEVKKS